ncbi:MAG: hypothetical protein IPM57_08370 [Oligoflexia bacterium]|nr:hypothetical protein [Oligoflexia bacterium]
MKKNIIFTLTIIITAVSVFAFEFYKNEKFMTLNEAQKKWGSTKFDHVLFKNGNEVTRASMVVSIIKEKTLIKKKISEVDEILGPNTGYYFSDFVPAYIIGNNDAEKGDVWQLILIPDNDSKYINEVKIHKKCCYKR